ncbi:MAG: hypothetical protein WCG62_02945, partial [Actinomycetes bacterium]
MTPTSESGLTPLLGWPLVAPPDLPCPVGSSGTLCTRGNSLKDLSKRFGASAVNFVNLIEFVCKSAAVTAGDTQWQTPTSTSCIWRRSTVSQPITVHTIGAHMHLLGKTLSVELCHTDKTCTDPSKVVGLFVGSYNFDDQHAYNVPPTVIHPGDYVKVTCTYDPKLRKLNPQTKKLPARFITWGDGSSDEMCLSSIGYSQGAGT